MDSTSSNLKTIYLAFNRNLVVYKRLGYLSCFLLFDGYLNTVLKGCDEIEFKLSIYKGFIHIELFVRQFYVGESCAETTVFLAQIFDIGT